MSEVFISYRRSDCEWSAGRIFDRLEQALGLDRVFFDVSGIAPGDDFIDILTDRIANCSVCLAIIGPKWLEELSNRSADAHDFVRIEIEAAINKNIRLIPVLIDGATMPRPDDLPSSIALLSRRNAVVIRSDRFRADVDQLAEFLMEEIGPKKPSKTDFETGYATTSSQEQSFEGEREFRDFEDAPAMVLMPRGNFEIGPPPDANAEELETQDKSKIAVRFLFPFAISASPITVGQFATFVKSSGYSSALFGMWTKEGGRLIQEPGRHFRNPGFEQGEDHPAVGLSWRDASAYAQWLAQTSGFEYRLPSEAEWEYAARAGATRLGACLDYDPGGVASQSLSPDAPRTTLPVRTFKANKWGFYLVFGQVWEWCEDVWHADYGDLPQDGKSWTEGGDPNFRVVRGGCAGTMPLLHRSRGPSLELRNDRFGDLGFRVARTI